MAVSRHTIIAPEGWTSLSLVVLAAVLVQFFFTVWSIPLWMLLIVLLFIFRDPHRQCPPSPLAIVSPVQGTVCDVEQVHDPYLHRSAYRIQIKMSIWSVFSVCSITEGKVQKQWHQSRTADGKQCPCYAIWIQTDEQDDVVLVLRPGRWLHRLSFHFITGERVGQGHRNGFILFGSLVDVYIAESSNVCVEKGKSVACATDILAQLVHN